MSNHAFAERVFSKEQKLLQCFILWHWSTYKSSADTRGLILTVKQKAFLATLDYLLSLFEELSVSSTSGSVPCFPLWWLAVNLLAFSGTGDSIGSEAQGKRYRLLRKTHALGYSWWICVSLLSLLTTHHDQKKLILVVTSHTSCLPHRAIPQASIVDRVRIGSQFKVE